MLGISEFQKYVGFWGMRTFPRENATSRAEHLAREVEELKEAISKRGILDIGEEAADCFILLLGIAHMYQFDLFGQATKKMITNELRRWGEPDELGVIEHIREA